MRHARCERDGDLVVPDSPPPSPLGARPVDALEATMAQVAADRPGAAGARAAELARRSLETEDTRRAVRTFLGNGPGKATSSGR